MTSHPGNEPARSVVMTTGERERLRALVESPALAALKRTYIPPEGACCDLFQYDVTAQLADRRVERTTVQGIVVPDELQQVIDLLLGVMSRRDSR